MNKEINPVTILVADDDEDDRTFTRQALEEKRLANDLRFTIDGQDTIDYLRRRGRWSDPESSPRPGLILLDLNMPKRNGHEVLAEIKHDKELSSIPVIVLTTSRADEDIVRSYGLGVNSFITKPVTFDQLVEVLGTWSDYWLEIVSLPDAAG